MGHLPLTGDFPNRDSLIRLVGAVLAEQHDEWTESCSYLALDVLARSRMRTVPDTITEEASTIPQALTA